MYPIKHKINNINRRTAFLCHSNFHVHILELINICDWKSLIIDSTPWLFAAFLYSRNFSYFEIDSKCNKDRSVKPASLNNLGSVIPMIPLSKKNIDLTMQNDMTPKRIICKVLTILKQPISLFQYSYIGFIKRLWINWILSIVR